MQHSEGLPWGLVLFNIFICDLEQVTKYALIRAVDDTRLGGPDSAQGRFAIQRDLGRLRTLTTRT